MPVKIYNEEGKAIFIHPTQQYRVAPSDVKVLKADENFYISVKETGD